MSAVYLNTGGNGGVGEQKAGKHFVCCSRAHTCFRPLALEALMQDGLHHAQRLATDLHSNTQHATSHCSHQDKVRAHL
jgi:hypothetical protein